MNFPTHLLSLTPFSPFSLLPHPPPPNRVVKEEISDDNAKLPCFNGRVVSWVSVTDDSPASPEPSRALMRIM